MAGLREGLVTLSWNQPACDSCYGALYPGRRPARVADEHREWLRCAFCGARTGSGIFVRHDPRRVPYPALEEDTRDA